MAGFGSINLEEMIIEDNRLNNEPSVNGGFLEQFVPMPEVKPGQTGSVSVRILPPPFGGDNFYQYNRTHKINGRSVHCPRPLVNGKWDFKIPCPICEYYNSLWKNIDKIEREHGKDCHEVESLKSDARDLKPIERYYYNAIVRSMVLEGKEVKNIGPRILSVGKILHTMVFNAIFGVKGDLDSKLGNITCIKNGYDFIIRKAVTLGSEGFPKYDSSGFARNSSPAGNSEEIEKWSKSLHDLTKLRNPSDVIRIEKELAIHRGLIPDEKQTFDINGFDVKWSKKNPEESVKKEVSEETTKVQVSVPDGVPSSKKSSAKKSASPVVEDVSIEDEDFLKELEGMEN